MNMKKLVTLLLAAAMLFSLSACGTIQNLFGGGSGSSGPKLDDSKAENRDYTIGVDAMQAFISDPSIDSYATLLGDNIAAQELANFIRAYEDFYGQESGAYISPLADSVRGGTISGSEDEPQDENSVGRTQRNLDTFRANLRSGITASREQLAQMSDKEWESLAMQRGMSVQEMKALSETLIQSMEALLAALEDVTVEETHVVRIDLDGASSSSQYVTVCFADGRWFTEALLDTYI